MLNLETMKQLLDRGIEPTLLNEVLRRELAEAAPKAQQVAVQATLNFRPTQWTAEGEGKPHPGPYSHLTQPAKNKVVIRVGTVY